MVETWITAEDAAKIFETSIQNIHALAGRGKVKKILGRNENKTGRQPFNFSYADLVNHFGEPEKTIAEIFEKRPLHPRGGSEPKESEKIETLEEISISESGEISASISKVEAERILRIEQARAKRYENLELAGKLLNWDDVNNELEDLLALTWELARECIDKWKLEYRFSPEQTRKMQDDFNRIFENGLRKCREKAQSAAGKF